MSNLKPLYYFPQPIKTRLTMENAISVLRSIGISIETDHMRAYETEIANTGIEISECVVLPQ